MNVPKAALIAAMLLTGCLTSACSRSGLEPIPTLYTIPSWSVTPNSSINAPVETTSSEATSISDAPPASATPTNADQPTLVIVTPTDTIASAQVTNCTPDAHFLADVTIPDNTVLTIGQAFTKTWRLENSGTCDWGAGYRIVFWMGDQMDAPSQSDLPPVAAGQTVDISLNMVAPPQPGTHLGIWRLLTANSVPFGEQPYVQIISTYSDGTLAPTPRATATIGPTSANGTSAKTPTPTKAATPTKTNTVSPSACTNNAAFLLDVSVPDNSQMNPGQAFTKTWRLQNNGTCTWGAGYKLVFVSGSQMGAPASTSIHTTAAGQTVDVSVNMVAPTANGVYTAIWQMRAPDGTPFGTPPYISIVVGTPQAQAPTNYPAVSGITSRSRQIYVAGKQLGNNPYAFAKVGDSLTATYLFLYLIGDGMQVLGDYSYLAEAINHFMTPLPEGGTSFGRVPKSAYGGWDSNTLLDPSRADPACNGLTPFECELVLLKPSAALIQIGTNDAQDHLSSGLYEANLRRLMDIAISHGVIPVLYTIPWNMYRDPAPFNAVITNVARSYDTPLVDYWSQMEKLPGHGIGDDGVHPTEPPDHNAANFITNLGYGTTVRNLVTLQLLDALWRSVMYD